MWFYVQEHPKAQPTVVLILKRLRRRGPALKSYPTYWEKPSIEPAIPGLQDIGFSPTPRAVGKMHNYGYIVSPRLNCIRTFVCIYYNNISVVKLKPSVLTINHSG